MKAKPACDYTLDFRATLNIHRFILTISCSLPFVSKALILRESLWCKLKCEMDLDCLNAANPSQQYGSNLKVFYEITSRRNWRAEKWK